MATELCGSKLISPYFGSSLYVWASVIAITLGSLAAGYFFGGKLSLKENKIRILRLILALSAVYMGFMPIITNAFAPIAIGFPLLGAVVVSAVLLLVFPMFLMGAASPIVISIQTENANDSGRVSGLVYSVSTVGGIISTFLCGFYFIPEFGISTTLILFGALLLTSLLLILQKTSPFKLLLFLFILIILGFTNKAPIKNCIYESDGLLGKLNVINDTIGGVAIRKLLVNNVVQSEMDLQSKKSVSQYVTLLDSNIGPVSQTKALVLGLGGGLTSNLLVKKGFSVEGVELDQRIINIGYDFFGLNRNVKAICDDARHYLNVSPEHYSLILMDVFKAEEQPSHVLTMESIETIKKMLVGNGQLIINWHGYAEGQRGLGTSILLNTLKRSGFKYKLAAASEKEDERNLLIFAGLAEPIIRQNEVNPILQSTELVNTDNQPVLEKYNAIANQTWRKNYILYYYSGY